MTFKELLKDKEKKKSFTIRYTIFIIVIFLLFDILTIGMPKNFELYRATATFTSTVFLLISPVIKVFIGITSFILGILFWKQPFLHYVFALILIIFTAMPYFCVISFPFLVVFTMGRFEITWGPFILLPPYEEKESRYK